jgi:hypothetical protein
MLSRGPDETEVGIISDCVGKGWSCDESQFYLDNPDLFPCISSTLDRYILTGIMLVQSGVHSSTQCEGRSAY